VRRHQGDRYTKLFGSQDHQVVVVFDSWPRADSLHAMEAGSIRTVPIMTIWEPLY
jgi:hypothetical protein